MNMLVGAAREREVVRSLILKEGKRCFFATDLGEVVTDKLVSHFPKIMDAKFTGQMEDELDQVEEAKIEEDLEDRKLVDALLGTKRWPEGAEKRLTAKARNVGVWMREQGDPGAARFFLSLEDDLMRLFSPDRIIKVMDRLGVEEGEVITHSMVTKAIEKAQVRVEAQNYEIRKRLLEYDDVVNKQREVVYGLRRQALTGEGIREQYQDFIADAVEAMVGRHCRENEAPDFWDMKGLALDFQTTFLAPLPLKDDEHLSLGFHSLEDLLLETALAKYKAKEERLGEDLTRQLEKLVLLQILDEQWRDHLNELILLRSGIGLRSYGQRDPLVEYKKEAFILFQALMDAITGKSLNLFFRAEIAPPERPREPAMEKMQAQHSAVSAYQNPPAAGGPEAGPTSRGGRDPGLDSVGPAPVTRDQPKVGRNDPCPCGSGKKYKKCCGR